MSIKDYNRKRKFDQTPEPEGERATGKGPLRFLVQLHDASRLHYDFRIEADGVLKSWAVPKGPSTSPQDQRLAVQVEDHPIAYGSFEGIIPKGNYGAGTVMIWDEGTYLERTSQGREDSERAILKGLEEGHVTLLLEGTKLRGEFALVRLKDGDEKAWLLIKKRDAYSSHKDITRQNLSVKTGRTMQDIAREAPAQGAVWLPARTEDSEAGSKKSITPVPSPGIPPEKPVSAKTEKIPRRNKPMIPTSLNEPFDQSGWIFEIDHQGYRAIAEIEKGSVHLYSKQNLPFNLKFPKITEALRHAKITAVLDGEIVEGENNSPAYWVRDLLHLEGRNLRTLPLIERKKKLEKLGIFGEVIRYCPHEADRGIPFFETAAAAGHTGILARDAYSPYVAGTTKRWLRISANESTGEDRAPRLSHLDKIYWPQGKVTKGDLIEYYRSVAPVLLPHLKDRPESMHRFPDGVEAQGFFQKDLVGHHPRWIQTERIFSESSGKSIDYLVCQNEWTLLYMANLGCIELNPWLSRVGSLNRPDSVVIDLDPDDNDFSEVVEVALIVHRILEKVGATHFCKTSGATGLHIFIPLQARYDYETGRRFAEAVCQLVHRASPENTSLIRSPAKRRGKIYLDCLQNVQGQTVAAAYSVRPRTTPTVSTPLRWEELTPDLRPEAFTIQSLPARLEKVGDLWHPVLEEAVDLELCLARLDKGLLK